MMTDFRLRVFQCVAKHLSFTRASQELFISQPAITRHIHELESAYHVRLFERQGNRIALTEAGKLMLQHCERILDDYKALEYSMNLLQGEYVGDLRLGASTTVQQYVLPAILADFIQQFPSVNISLLNGNSRFIESAVEKHDIGLGIVEGTLRLPYLRYTTFLEDELVAVVHTKSRYASLPDEITLDELQTIPLVLREQGSGTLEVIEQAFMQHGIKLSQLKVMMYLGSTESIKRFLMNCDCMGIVSIRSIAPELAAGKLRVIDIPEMPMNRTFSFVQCQGQEQEGGLEQAFMRFALAQTKRKP